MRWGLGIPMRDIDMPEDLIRYHFFFDLWIDMWLYTFSIGSLKFVILGLYWRTFSLSVTRWPIRILSICSGCWLIVRVSSALKSSIWEQQTNWRRKIFLITMQCQPIHKFWHEEIPGKCSIPAMLSLFMASVPHFLIEVGILVCPLYEISRLRITTARKYVLGAMFGAGIL